MTDPSLTAYNRVMQRKHRRTYHLFVWLLTTTLHHTYPVAGNVDSATGAVSTRGRPRGYRKPKPLKPCLRFPLVGTVEGEAVRWEGVEKRDFVGVGNADEVR